MRQGFCPHSSHCFLLAETFAVNTPGAAVGNFIRLLCTDWYNGPCLPDQNYIYSNGLLSNSISLQLRNNTLECCNWPIRFKYSISQVIMYKHVKYSLIKSFVQESSLLSTFALSYQCKIGQQSTEKRSVFTSAQKQIDAATILVIGELFPSKSCLGITLKNPITVELCVNTECSI